MDIKEYIESGIIENYVLGLAPEQEVMQLLELSKAHPELKEEISKTEEALMSYAELHSHKQHTEKVKQNIFRQINRQPDPKIIQLSSHYKAGWLKPLAAAAVVLFVVSASVNYILFNKLKKAENQLAQVEADKSILVQEIEFEKASLQKNEETINKMLAVGVQPVTLKGLPVSPQSKAIVYWNSVTHQTHIIVSSLPVPPQGKQYQLWALVNGKPVDAGVFDVNTQTDSVLQQVKNVDAAQTFAVTLENKGGSPVPTLTALYVMGNL